MLVNTPFMASQHPSTDKTIEKVEQVIQHTFQRKDLLLQALTHSSFSNENRIHKDAAKEIRDNERLEFLGDAVLGIFIAEHLMELFPNASEGHLSRWRSSLVSRKTLAEIAYELRLGDFMQMGRGERHTGGGEKRSILAGVFEALVGAIYLDGGLEKVGPFLKRVFQRWFEGVLTGTAAFLSVLDNKTHLQEMTQMNLKTIPVYRLVRSWGAEHEKRFSVEIVIDGKIICTGEGKSKKEAEQQAAETAIQMLGF